MGDLLINCKNCENSCKIYGKHEILYHIKTRERRLESFSGEEATEIEENSANALKLKR